MENDDNNDTAAKANLILLRFVTDKASKLRYGAKLRSEMQESIARGEEPKGYRVTFIIETVTELFKWLGERAAEFNAKHPMDALSVDDFSDILATASSRIKGKK